MKTFSCYSLLFPDLDTCGNPAPLQLHRFKMRRSLAGHCGCSGDDSLRFKVGSSSSEKALLDRLLFTRCNMFPRDILRVCAYLVHVSQATVMEFNDLT